MLRQLFKAILSWAWAVMCSPSFLSFFYACYGGFAFFATGILALSVSFVIPVFLFLFTAQMMGAMASVGVTYLDYLEWSRQADLGDWFSVYLGALIVLVGLPVVSASLFTRSFKLMWRGMRTLFAWRPVAEQIPPEYIPHRDQFAIPMA